VRLFNILNTDPTFCTFALNFADRVKKIAILKEVRKSAAKKLTGKSDFGKLNEN
jgi:hypothetical protein